MIDISNLANKTENKGATPQGKLSAEEFNTLVNAVLECQETSVRSITLNGQDVKFVPDDNGNVNIIITESSYVISASMVFDMEPPYKVALGNDFISHIKISNKYVDGDSTIPATTSCKLYIYHNNVNVDTLTVYDSQTIDYNWGKLLNEGTNQIYVKLDNTFGDIFTTPIFEVNTIALSCAIVNFNQTEIKTGDSWELSIKVIGTEATVYISIDGAEFLSTTQGAGSTITYNITEGLTNGIHKVSVYAIATEDTTVKTATDEYEYIYADGAYNQLIIASTLKDNTTIKLYNILKIVYWAYLKDFTGNKTAIISIRDSIKGNIIETTQTIEFINGISSQKTWDAPLFDINCIGLKDINITIDDVERNIPIYINEPDYWLKEIDGSKVYLSSAGRSNTMENVSDWSFGDYYVTFPEDMEWAEYGSGWNYDIDNNVALHLRKGKEISLNYQPFKENPAYGNDIDIPGTKKGLTFSIEFATRNCIKRDASVVKCIYNGVGFEFYANSMKFASATESITADYKEDTRIRIDLVIEGLPTTYTYYDYSDKTTKTSDEARMLVYVDGVYQQMVLLNETSNFKQEIPQNITIGSEFCDIDIYCIRIYETALNMENITTNYSFDTPNITDKIEIAKRCNVFDSKLNVAYSLLSIARPDLPIMILNMPELPTSKDRLAVTTTSYNNPLNKDNYDKGNASFTVGVGNAEMGNQGTSSMNYPMPYRNFDWRIGKKSIEKPFEIGSQFYKKYPLYEGMPPIKKFTFKKDYASSEMCNNAICSAIFTDMACGIYKEFPNAITLPMQAAITAGESINKYRMGLKAIPMFIFQYNNNEYTPLGMFNFIPNKNEEEYLGFTKVGNIEYTFESTQRAQSWEIRDNNIFWDFHMTAPHKNADGTISNDIFKYYEAIYPKDSTSGADDTDFGDATETILDYAINETKDLLRLHNWLVDCNQLCATGSILETPYIASNITYNYDTPEYRRAKFINEHEDYLVLDQWILYYIWREQFWMYDSGSKNLQIHTYDGQHWGCHVRDCDTGLGTDNEGKLMFPPYLEDFDYIIDNEFSFNHKDTRPENSSTVLNGQLGSIWINIRDCFQNKIQSMYNILFTNSKTTYFSYDDAIKYFEGHQGQWSEALYNFGSKQYYGGTPYSKWISSGLGDKKNQRRYWLYYAFRYRMSKYHANSGSNRITWRTWGNGSDLLIKPYCQLYVCLGFGAYDYSTTTRYRCLNPDEGVLVKNEYKTTVADNVAYLFNGDLITDLGNLYEFGDIGSLDLTYAKRLRYLRLGNHMNLSSYMNTKQQELKLDNCPALEYIDLTNCKGFGKGETQNGIYNLILTNQILLQELYCKGSSISNITFPQTASLRTIELGADLTDLRLENLTGLTNFSIENGSKISNIRIINCGKISSELSYNILVQIFSSENNLKSVNIQGINWTNASGEIIEKLCDLKANLQGYINLSRAKPMSYALKTKLVKQYGDIDNPSNPLHITYQAYEITNLLCDDKIYFETPGEYQISFSVPNVNGNNFVVDGVTYEMEYNEYATIDSKTGKITVNYLGEEYEDGTGPNYDLTITMKLYKIDEVKFVINLNEQYIISSKINLNFWNRELRIGDVVYHDGFTSSAKDVETYKAQGREPVGICFYIDKVDPTLRLMFAINPPASNSYICWGPSGNDITPGSIEFQDVTEQQLFDISEIPNTGETGLNSNISNWSKIVFENTPGKYEFIDFPETCCLHYGGFIDLDNQRIPHAKYFTESAIKLRNKTLMDSGLTDLDFSIPTSNNSTTEMNNLLSAIDKAVKINHEYNTSNDLECLYYPAISMCYAYKPTQKTSLNPKFGEHMWFCPCMGDLLKIGYYLYNYYTKENTAMDKFKDAIDNGVLNKSIFESGNNNFCSINESSLYNSYPYYIWVMRLNMTENGYGRKFDTNQGFGAETAVYITQKYSTSFKILPICQF